mmetsp:Transcript_1562/g.3342  ORF Transcript_1562/g.3342 Transcript_1562/m.3342 type:complete len:465 (-) Transcript_1562:1286-2680(-)
MSGRNVLLRRYLCKRLAEYYSQPADKVVGSIDSGFISRIPSGISSCGASKISSPQQPETSPRSIDFSSLFNEWHWKHTYKRVYKEQQGMWLTPVELFFPYYSNILGNFVSESMTTALNNMTMRNDGLFEIVELGGGRGTNAMALLNHLSECHSDMYKRLHCYTIFDTSPTLHELQRKVLIDGSRHADKVKLVNIDMMDVAEGNSMFLAPSDMPTAVISLELLDNLPHDKIGKCMETGEILQAEVAPASSIDSDPVDKERASSTWTHLDTSQPYIETFSSMNDPLLQHILSVAPSLYQPTVSMGPRWVPTVALGILLKLFECRPNSSVAFADFDWLPPPDVGSLSDTRPCGNDGNLALVEPAVGDPIVTDLSGNDHLCYLTSPPDALCDILFPTDFGRFAAFAKSAIEQSGSKTKRFSISALAMKQSDFLMKYGSGEVNKTKGWTGYSPLTNDFGNCSVLAVTPR